MGTGAGGIYRGTYGDTWLNGGEFYAVAPTVRDLSAERLMALTAAIGSVLVLDGFGLPDIMAMLQRVTEAAEGAVDDSFGDEVAPPDGLVRELIPRVLEEELAAWIAQKASELGLEGYSDENEEKPGIYENCKYAEAALTVAFPGTVPDADASRRVPRFLFHEEAYGGHFGIDDASKAPIVLRRSRSPVYVMEHCAEIGGTSAAGWALFVALSRGGTPKLLIENSTGSYKGTGISCGLADGTRVAWRWITGTEASPAVEINNSPDSRVINQKVHFYDGESRHRG